MITISAVPRAVHGRVRRGGWVSVAIQMPPLAALSADEVVRLIAPTVTLYLTAPTAELGLPELGP